MPHLNDPCPQCGSEDTKITDVSEASDDSDRPVKIAHITCKSCEKQWDTT